MIATFLCKFQPLGRGFSGPFVFAHGAQGNDEEHAVGHVVGGLGAGPNHQFESGMGLLLIQLPCRQPLQRRGGGQAAESIGEVVQLALAGALIAQHLIGVAKQTDRLGVVRCVARRILHDHQGDIAGLVGMVPLQLIIAQQQADYYGRFLQRRFALLLGELRHGIGHRCLPG
ncbi:hypothetical protein CR157_13110 [Halomonas sp. LBP4]|nr:hypothetical protein CR157_13110 [Halomonas sp. LBP4]